MQVHRLHGGLDLDRRVVVLELDGLGQQDAIRVQYALDFHPGVHHDVCRRAVLELGRAAYGHRDAVQREAGGGIDARDEALDFDVAIIIAEIIAGEARWVAAILEFVGDQCAALEKVALDFHQVAVRRAARREIVIQAGSRVIHSQVVDFETARGGVQPADEADDFEVVFVGLSLDAGRHDAAVRIDEAVDLEKVADGDTLQRAGREIVVEEGVRGDAHGLAERREGAGRQVDGLDLRLQHLVHDHSLRGQFAGVVVDSADDGRNVADLELCLGGRAAIQRDHRVVGIVTDAANDDAAETGNFAERDAAAIDSGSRVAGIPAAGVGRIGGAFRAAGAAAAGGEEKYGRQDGGPWLRQAGRVCIQIHCWFSPRVSRVSGCVFMIGASACASPVSWIW